MLKSKYPKGGTNLNHQIITVTKKQDETKFLKIFTMSTYERERSKTEY